VMTVDTYDTDPCADTEPPPHADEDTDPRGTREPSPGMPSVPLGLEAQGDLLVRLVLGVEALGRDVRAMRADLRTVLEEGRGHARRLTALEGRIAGLRCQAGEECPG
jgi:hypothetical protein